MDYDEYEKSISIKDENSIGTGVDKNKDALDEQPKNNEMVSMASGGCNDPFNLDQIPDGGLEDDDADDPYSDFDSDYESDSDTNSDDDAITEGETILGIDLGTTNSCVAVWKNNNLVIIPDEYGNRTIPSVVSFTKNTVYIGSDAKNQQNINSENTFYETKRLIGREFIDDSVKKDAKYLAYTVQPGHNNNITLKNTAGGKNAITPEEVAAMVLKKCRNMACDYLREDIDKAVITVPAYFNNAQKSATQNAASIAGLKCVRIINEPTAAALAYGLEDRSVMIDKSYTVIVYDLGGGTLDVSLLRIDDGCFEVLASNGNTRMGGSDFDKRIMSYCINSFKKKNKLNGIKSISALSIQVLRNRCETSKKLLSTSDVQIIFVKDFYDGFDLCVKLTKTTFYSICRDLFILCVKPLDDIIRSCDLLREDIDDIILVGGGTRMPKIRENLKLFFGKEPNHSVNPDEVVAAGASIQGYILANKESPFAESVTLLDIIPLSLGVEVIGGLMNVIIPRNSVIPLTRHRKYTTDTDYETTVTIKIFEGEREMTKNNECIGQFDLTGIDEAPRGIPEIDVTFNIDVNGIINVTAMDVKNKENKRSITVNSLKGRLTKEEIGELVESAKMYKEEDKLSRILRSMFYEIEDVCSNILINVHNEDNKLKPEQIEAIDQDIKEINVWLKDKPYDDRQKGDYIDILKRLRKKYNVLMLKTTHNEDNVRGKLMAGNEIGGTTIFNDDDDEEIDDEKVFEDIEADEFKLCDNITVEEKAKVKELRENIVDLCYSIYDLINSDMIKIKNEDRTKLKDLIDETLLWVHIKQKICSAEYEEKIKVINKNCGDIMEEYNESIFDDGDVDKNKRVELEELCLTIKLSIGDRHTNADDELAAKILVKIDDTFDWLADIDLDKIKITDDQDKELLYQEKIDEINDLCNQLYKELLNIGIDSTKIVNVGDKRDLHSGKAGIAESDLDTTAGTTLDKLLKMTSK
jgi:heat shock 70kDa protein 1/2/6/8